MMQRAIFARRLATAASQAGAPKRESTFKRVWLKETAAYPIIFITAVAAAMSVYKIYHAARNPDYHFNRHERSTMDYLENQKDVEKVKDFAKNTIHSPPEIIKSLARAKGYIDLK